MVRPVDLYAWRNAITSENGPSNPLARMVLMAVSMHMKADGTGAWPSQGLIAKRAGVGLRSVKRHLEALDSDGWIERSFGRSAGQKWPRTEYAATVPDRVYESLPERQWEADPTWRRGATAAPRDTAIVPTATNVGATQTPAWCQPGQVMVPLSPSHGAKAWPTNSSENSSENSPMNSSCEGAAKAAHGARETPRAGRRTKTRTPATQEEIERRRQEAAAIYERETAGKATT